MYFTPSGSTLYDLWQTFGSLVLLRGLNAVVATAAAEETGEAFTVPFEAAVAFLLGSVAAVGAGVVAIVLGSRSGDSESFGCSAEKSSVKLYVSMKCVIEAKENGYTPACRRRSRAAEAQLPSDRKVYTRKSIETELPRPMDLSLSCMILARACRRNKQR